MNPAQQSETITTSNAESLLLACSDFSYETGAALSVEFGFPALKLDGKKNHFKANSQGDAQTTMTKFVPIDPLLSITDQLYRSFRKSRKRTPVTNRAIFVLSTSCIETLNADGSLYINSSFQRCGPSNFLFAFKKEVGCITFSSPNKQDGDGRVCEIVPAPKFLFEWN
jgi:hypothetical protein